MSTPWTLTDAQRAVDEWISQWDDGYWPALANLARLTEEVGELARELNLHHGPKPPKTGADAPDPDRIADEIGDVLFVLITLANSLDVDLDQALRAALEKIGARDAQRFTPKS